MDVGINQAGQHHLSLKVNEDCRWPLKLQNRIVVTTAVMRSLVTAMAWCTENRGSDVTILPWCKIKLGSAANIARSQNNAPTLRRMPRIDFVMSFRVAENGYSVSRCRRTIQIHRRTNEDIMSIVLP